MKNTADEAAEQWKGIRSHDLAPPPPGILILPNYGSGRSSNLCKGPPHLPKPGCGHRHRFMLFLGHSHAASSVHTDQQWPTGLERLQSCVH